MEENKNNFQLSDTDVLSNTIDFSTELTYTSHQASSTQNHYSLPSDQLKRSQRFENFLSNEAVNFISPNELGFRVLNFIILIFIYLRKS